MTSGLDATLVGALETIAIDSTDFLCLSSFSHNLALVSSLPLPEAAAHWQRLGLSGQVAAMGDLSGQSQRRVVYFALSSGSQAIIAQLKQLLVDKSVKTVGLQMPGAAPKRVEILSPPIAQPAARANASSLPSTSRTGPTPVDSSPIPEEAWVDLDRLVDDFEALDL